MARLIIAGFGYAQRVIHPVFWAYTSWKSSIKHGTRYARTVWYRSIMQRGGVVKSFLAALGVACLAGAPACHQDPSGELMDSNPDAGLAMEAGARIRVASYGAGMPENAVRGVCEINECEPRLQDCQTGTCTLVNDRTACIPAEGTIAEGQACASSSECDSGLACFQTNQGARCQRICCPGDESLCLENQKCGGSGVLFESSTALAWGFCTPVVTGCDVFGTDETCELGEACYITAADGSTECLRAGHALAGETCGYNGKAIQNLCAPGLICLAGMACERLCELSDDSEYSCAPHQGVCSIVGFAPENVGVCMP
ncbi:MAG: hypothetical protein H6714_04005 [Myxococcales bacterium]|nr:hypothetical protein [Myxococcales bacterium]